VRSLCTFPGRSAARRAAACCAADPGSSQTLSFERSRICSATLRAALRPGSVIFSIAVLLCLFASLALAFDFPPLTGRVVDQAGVISAQAKSDIEAKAKTLEDKSGIQLVVATVKSLEGSDIETYGYQLGRFWKLGEAKKNNGVLLLVAPKERKVRIEVGYGLEGTLTDALSSVIINTAIIPRFKSGDFSGGIERGVDGIISVLSGDSAEWQPKVDVRREDTSSGFDGLFPLLFFLIMIFIIWYLIRNAGDGRPPGPGSRSTPIIFPGGWGSDWGGGGSGGGGGFDGGFSGGGGSFGGGGASGSW
jgi:uncharacterized protein